MADQKPVTKETNDVERMRREIDELKAKLDAREAALVASATDVPVDEAQRKWLELSSEEKTRLAVQKEFGHLRGQPGVHEFEVGVLVTDEPISKQAAKEHPRLRIPAHSELEAIGFYANICGITNNEHNYDVKRVGNAA